MWLDNQWNSWNFKKIKIYFVSEMCELFGKEISFWAEEIKLFRFLTIKNKTKQICKGHL